MPCINAPANTWGAARRACGHGAPMMSAAQPITIAVKEKRATRNNSRSACGSTAFATMNPVDQINTNITGMPSRSVFNASPYAASAVSSKRVEQAHRSGFVVRRVTGYHDQVVQQSGRGDLLIQRILRVRRSEA